MPRDAGGNYTLPSGNPVISGTPIETTWANPTMEDVAAELTDSLSRSGNGGMLVGFKTVNGDANAPAYSFTSNPTSGMFLQASGILAFTANSSKQLSLDAINGATFDSDVIVNGALTLTGQIDATGNVIITKGFPILGLVNTTDNLSYRFIVNDGSDNFQIQKGDADLASNLRTDFTITNADGAVRLFFGGNQRIETTTTGVATTGDLLNSGIITTLGSFRGKDGTVGSTSYGFTSDPDSGMFGGVGLVAFATGGVERGAFDANGLRLQNGSASRPSYAFTNNIEMGMYRAAGDQLGFAVAGVRKMRILTGTINTDVPIAGAQGVKAAPSYVFAADITSGMWLSSPGQVRISASGNDNIGIHSDVAFLRWTGATRLTTDDTGIIVNSGGNTELRVFGSGAGAAGIRFINTLGTVQMTIDAQGDGAIGQRAPSNGVFQDTWLNLKRDGGVSARFNNLIRTETTQVGLTITGTAFTNSGTAALPAYSFTSDTNTGMYRPNADQIALTVGGVNKMTLSAAQAVFTEQLVVTDSIIEIDRVASTADVQYRARNDNGGFRLKSNSAGQLLIQQISATAVNEDVWITCTKNGGVALHFNGTQQLTTLIDGVNIPASSRYQWNSTRILAEGVVNTTDGTILAGNGFTAVLNGPAGAVTITMTTAAASLEDVVFYGHGRGIIATVIAGGGISSTTVNINTSFANNPDVLVGLAVSFEIWG